MQEARPMALQLNVEDSVAGFLGILMETQEDRSIELKQSGLIDRIVKVMDLESASEKSIPADSKPLGKDMNGALCCKSWSYASVVSKNRIIILQGFQVLGSIRFLVYYFISFSRFCGNYELLHMIYEIYYKDSKYCVLLGSYFHKGSDIRILRAHLSAYLLKSYQSLTIIIWECAIFCTGNSMPL